MLVFVTNLSLMKFRVRYLPLICWFFSVIDGSGWLWTGGFSKNIKLRLEFLKSSFLVLHLFYYTLINNLPDDVIYNIAIYVDDITLYSKCDQSSDDDN